MAEKQIGAGYMVGFDMGTSGLKCVAVDPKTGKTITIYTEWSLVRLNNEHVELDCETIRKSVLHSIRWLKKSHKILPSQIKSIGSCALCPGLIALDETGKPLTNAIIFMDSRSQNEAAALNELIGAERCFEITANKIMAGAASVTTMAWIKNNLPAVYARTKYFVHLPTWLGFLLTNQIKMDHSNAAGTCLYDIHKCAWSPELITAAGIDSAKLPRLARGFELLGGLENEELIAEGLTRGLPVAVGAGDTACTALGLGVREHGQAFISFGTSSVITAISNKSLFDPRITARSFLFENTWALAGAMSCTGASLKWFRNALCDGISFETIDKIAADAGLAAGGLLFLPYLNGERSPVFDPKARGVFLGVSLGTERAHFARAILEGAAYGIRQLLEIEENLLGVRIDDLPVAGGGSKSAVWMQMIADVLGRRLHAADTAEAGAVGAALLGGIAGKIVPWDYRLPEKAARCYTPNPVLYPAYTAQFERYLKLYPAVKELF